VTRHALPRRIEHDGDMPTAPTSTAPISTVPTSAGDAVPPHCGLIEVHVAELRQLFNAIDPSPFQERDLDPRAEEFIVEWSRDLPGTATLALVVHLERAAGPPEEAVVLRDAIREFFHQRAVGARRQLRELFRRGRISLGIALVFLGASIAAGDALATSFPASHVSDVLREGLLIVGWVAMWRPLEVFLYDWWPIRAEARLFDRLSAMLVRIEYRAATAEDAWRRDWPSAPTHADTTPAATRRDRPANRLRDSMTTHQHTPDEERRIREATLDRTIEDSFPASDPPSTDPNPDDDTILEEQPPAEGAAVPPKSR
jgi:hypothetical protein